MLSTLRHVVTSNEDNCIGGAYTDGNLHKTMMKQYHCYVLPDNCALALASEPIKLSRLKRNLNWTLFSPTATGTRTALAEELNVELTPTPVVVHESVPVTTTRIWDMSSASWRKISGEIVGANNIIEHLQALDAYTYAHQNDR